MDAHSSELFRPIQDPSGGGRRSTLPRLPKTERARRRQRTKAARHAQPPPPPKAPRVRPEAWGVSDQEILAKINGLIEDFHAMAADPARSPHQRKEAAVAFGVMIDKRNVVLSRPPQDSPEDRAAMLPAVSKLARRLLALMPEDEPQQGPRP